MRIGIDGLPLTEPLAGVGHYTLELARYLVNSDGDQIDVVSPKPFLPSLRALPETDPRLQLTEERVNLITRRWWTVGLPGYLRRSRVDVFHGTNFEIPLQPVCPTVVTIHDLSLLLHPQTHERRRVWRARRRLPLMAARATMIITVSEAVRQEVHRHLKIPLERIRTVHSAAREFFRPMLSEHAAKIRTRLNVPDDFILYSGTLEPRKNLPLLVRAFEKTSLAAPGLQLVLAGKKGWLVDDLYKCLRESRAGRDVMFTGYLTDRELCALYSTCKLFVYPSIYEGFGFPPLEAMACGAPVIATRVPSISEVVGSAARLVSPDSVDELAEAMLELLQNRSQRVDLIALGQKHAAKFSWGSTADRTRQVYMEAIERFNRGEGHHLNRRKSRKASSFGS